MSPDDLSALLRAARPEPPSALRERILTAMTEAKPASAWWRMTRTWGAAAAILLVGNYLLMSEYRTPTSHPGMRPPVAASVAIDYRDIPPVLVARLLSFPKPSPP